jgi:hypothetical protein
MHVLQEIYFEFRRYRNPLTIYTEEKQAFQWTHVVHDAFQTLKGALCAASILARKEVHRGHRRKKFGIGGVLSQV